MTTDNSGRGAGSEGVGQVMDRAEEKRLRRQRYGHFKNMLLAFMVGGMLLIAAVWLVGIWLVGLEATMAFHTEIRPYLHVWRTSVLVALLVFWPRWIGRLSDWLLMGPEFRQAMIAYRWRAALWIVLFELVIAYNVPVVFVQRLLEGA